MSTRAAPGPQLSAGRLRVDAARAIAKLREYMLVDRTAWVLEAIRAAVASGATQVRLSGDANDVWLAWEGNAWPADDLPKLFDELVSPEPTEERHHLRLLAAAVNSALGIEPAFVDVYAISLEGTVRARYTPEVLVETADIEDSALRKVAAEPAVAPAGVGFPSGMLVHLRRRAALGMLTYLFWEREPPELATARAACRDLAVPIAIGKTTFSREQWGSDVARVPFEGDLEGFVALVDPAAPRPPHSDVSLVVAERGVVLAIYPFPIALHGNTGTYEVRSPMPIRVFVDAKRMPTNASRSQVRQEVPPISTAAQRAPALIEKTLANLAAATTVADCEPKQRAAALAIVAAAIAGPEWSTLAFTQRLGALAKAPLLRDATGMPRPVGHVWSGHVYTGKRPLEPELGPWVSSILWVPPGDPAEAIVAGAMIDERDTKRRLKWAKQQRKAHRRFFAHEQRLASLTVKNPPWVRLTFGSRLPASCVPASWFENMTGEIGVSLARGDGEVLLMFQGRPIERVVMAAPIGFDAVIDAVHLTPGEGYKSVARDAFYTVVERALQASLICAAEVIAFDLGGTASELPAGCTTGPRSAPDVEARAIRAALGLAKDLGLPRSGVLARAPVWQTLDGEWLSLDALSKYRVLGVATANRRFRRPADRPILAGSAQLLGKVLPAARIVDYDKLWIDETVEETPERLARQLAFDHRYALAIAGDDIRGAIAPTNVRPLIHLHHVGQALDKREYTGTFGGCTLAVDSDRIVPDPEFRAAADTSNVVARDYRDWEVALVRATLRALTGDRPLELVGPAVTDLDNTLVDWAFGVLRKDPSPPVVDPKLDATLIADLERAPIVHALGEHHLISIDTLARRFPDGIPYVDKMAAPVPGFAPMVARPAVAEVVGKLAGLPVFDGTAELATRRKRTERDARIDKHRRQPELGMEYPFGGATVELASATLGMRGLVGVGRNRLEIDIRIENREFATLIRSDELPLYAVIDLAIEHANQDFIGLSDAVTKELIERVRDSAPALLAAIAKANPIEIADSGHPRKLLHKWLAQAKIAAFYKLRDELCAAPAFLTIYKTRLSLADAAKPNNVVRTSSWNTDWLAPAPRESVHSVDEGVLQLLPEDTELATVFDKLHPGRVVDVSDEVARLQSNRRMNRGLIPVPTLPHIPSELKRKLAMLGDIGERLGHGEIGLVGAGSSALIHDHGSLRQRLALDVEPAIQIAIEAPDLLDEGAAPRRPLDLAGDVADQLARLRDLGTRPAKPAAQALNTDAQELALRLLREVLATTSDLPPPVKCSIRRAVLRKKLPRDLVAKLPVFELADASWVTIAELEQQIHKFGNAWTVPRPTTSDPLDASRKLFVFTPDDLSAASGNYAAIDATGELALDAVARRNRERAPATELSLAGRDYLLAEVVLDGDGKTATRGIVAPLLPHAVDQRGIHPHRELVPFALMSDPCRWPTIAIIDDARLEPDRTWERPSATNAWFEVTSRVGATSERALSSIVPRPEGALAHLHLGLGVSLGPEVISSKLQIRGAVSLIAAPRAPIVRLDVFDAYGHHTYTPESPLGMSGTLYVHAPEGWDRERSLGEVVRRLYGHLVTQLLGKLKVAAKIPPTDLELAHIATALSLEVISPSDAGDLAFPCFRPAPLRPLRMMMMFNAHKDPVAVLPIAELEAELHQADAEGVIEDGSELSQAVIARLGARAVRGFQPKRIKPPITKPALPAVDVPPPKREPVKPKVETIHPIQNVVDAVHARLVDLVTTSFGVRIVESASPVIGFSKGLTFAGRDPRLHAIGNALRAGSPWAPMAIDALAAHAITVLDAAYSEVNQQTVRDVLESLLLEG